MCIRDRTKKPANLDGLKSLQMDGGKVGDKVIEYIGIIGEKLDLSYFEKIDAAHVQAYIHPVSYTHLDVYKRQVRSHE